MPCPNEMDAGRLSGGLSLCGIARLSKLDVPVLTLVDAHN